MAALDGESYVESIKPNDRFNGILLRKYAIETQKVIEKLERVASHVHEERANRTWMHERLHLNSTASEVVTPALSESMPVQYTIASGRKQMFHRAVEESGDSKGYLRKLGQKGIKRWSRRWFRQEGSSLYYFDDEVSVAWKGRIDLHDVKTICTTPASGAFDLYTASRVYHLMAETNEERVEWLAGLSKWKKHLERAARENDVLSDEDLAAAPEIIRVKSPPRPVFEVDSLEQGEEVQDEETAIELGVESGRQDEDEHRECSSPHTPTEATVNQKALGVENLKKQSRAETPRARIIGDACEEEFKTYFSPQPANIQEQLRQALAREERMKEEMSILQSELDVRREADSHARLMEKVKELNMEMREREHSLYAVEQKNKQLRERLQVRDSELAQVRDVVDALRKEGEAKQQQIYALKERVMDLRESSNQVSVSPVISESPMVARKESSSYQRPFSDDFELLRAASSEQSFASSSSADAYTTQRASSSREQVRRLRDSMEAHQRQTAFLAAELSRVEKESAAKLKAKSDTITRLKEELEELTKRYQNMRESSFTDGGANSQHLEEISSLRQELFVSIAVGIKLNMMMSGKSCNINAHSLYEEAFHLDRRKWRDWITRRMTEGS